MVRIVERRGEVCIMPLLYAKPRRIVNIVYKFFTVYPLFPAAKAYDAALNLDVGQFGAAVDKRRVGRVDRNQRDGLPLLVETFEGGLLPYADGGNLAVFNFGLTADADDIAVLVTRGHAVPFAGKRKISVPGGRDADAGLDVFLGSDGRTASDGADQRNGGHFRERLETGGDGAFFFSNNNRLITV